MESHEPKHNRHGFKIKETELLRMEKIKERTRNCRVVVILPIARLFSYKTGQEVKETETAMTNWCSSEDRKYIM